MRTARIAILAIGLTGMAILGVGCTSSSQYVPMPNMANGNGPRTTARIYLLRPNRFWGNDRVSIWDHDRIIGETKGRTFLCWERDAGKATISAESENKSQIDFPVESGKTYYVLQLVRMGVLRSRTKLQLVDSDAGKRWLQLCDPPDYVSN